MFNRKKREVNAAKKSSPPEDITHNQSKTNDDEVSYAAKKSNRVPTHSLNADGDTWVECFAVVESGRGDGKMVSRPYFQSKTTGLRVWDEPPSGASNIEYATEQVREMAELQVANYAVPGNTKAEKGKNKGKGKGKGLGLGWGKKKTKGEENQNKKNESNGEEMDQDLQMALVLSMTSNDATSSHDESLPAPYAPPPTSTAMQPSEEEEALAMALALSISENEAHEVARRDKEKEDEWTLQETLKRSQQEELSKEGGRKAFSPSTNVETPIPEAKNNDVDIEDDRKMPARPKNNPEMIKAENSNEQSLIQFDVSGQSHVNDIFSSDHDNQLFPPIPLNEAKGDATNGNDAKIPATNTLSDSHIATIVSAENPQHNQSQPISSPMAQAAPIQANNNLIDFADSTFKNSNDVKSLPDEKIPPSTNEIHHEIV